MKWIHCAAAAVLEWQGFSGRFTAAQSGFGDRYFLWFIYLVCFFCNRWFLFRSEGWEKKAFGKREYSCRGSRGAKRHGRAVSRDEWARAQVCVTYINMRTHYRVNRSATNLLMDPHMYHYALVYELMLSARSRHVNTMHLVCTARSLARSAVMKWQRVPYAHTRVSFCTKDAEGFCESVIRGREQPRRCRLGFFLFSLDTPSFGFNIQVPVS